MLFVYGLYLMHVMLSFPHTRKNSQSKSWKLVCTKYSEISRLTNYTNINMLFMVQIYMDLF